jgi:predicted nucleic acid-binding protein
VITAVDTNVLLDVFGADPAFGERSRSAIKSALLEGGLVACDVVWAEVAAAFPSAGEVSAAMDRLGVRFAALDQQAAVVPAPPGARTGARAAVATGSWPTSSSARTLRPVRTGCSPATAASTAVTSTA